MELAVELENIYKFMGKKREEKIEIEKQTASKKVSAAAGAEASVMDVINMNATNKKKANQYLKIFSSANLNNQHLDSPILKHRTVLNINVA